MKAFKTALLASAFALATTVSFAQVGANVGAGTSGGAAVGVGNSGTSGATKLKSSAGTNANVGGTRAKVGADASGNTAVKKKNRTTTGSGSAGAAINGSVR